MSTPTPAVSKPAAMVVNENAPIAVLTDKVSTTTNAGAATAGASTQLATKTKVAGKPTMIKANVIAAIAAIPAGETRAVINSPAAAAETSAPEDDLLTTSGKYKAFKVAMSVMLATTSDIFKKAEEAQAAYSELIKEIDQLKHAKSKLKADNDNLKRENEQLSDENKKMKRVIAEGADTNDKIKHQNARLTAEATKIEDDIAAGLNELGQVNANLNAARAELAQTEANLAAANEQVAQLEAVAAGGLSPIELRDQAVRDQVGPGLREVRWVVDGRERSLFSIVHLSTYYAPRLTNPGAAAGQLARNHARDSSGQWFSGVHQTSDGIVYMTIEAYERFVWARHHKSNTRKLPPLQQV